MILDLAHIFARRVAATVRAAEEPILVEPLIRRLPARRGRGWLPVREEDALHRAGMSSWCLRRSRAAEEKLWWGEEDALVLGVRVALADAGAVGWP